MIINYENFYRISANEILVAPVDIFWKPFYNFLNNHEEKYFYIEIIDDNKEIDAVITSDVIKLIKEKDVKLLFHMIEEGKVAVIYNIYRKWIVKENIPEEKIILYSGVRNIGNVINYFAKLFDKKIISAFFINSCETRIAKHYISQVNNLNFEKKFIVKKFLHFNRRLRLHRLTMLRLLYAKNLFEYGHISYEKEYLSKYKKQNYELELLPYLLKNQKLYNLFQKTSNIFYLLPSQYVDVKNLIDNHTLQKFNSNEQIYYNETLFSLVSETVFFKSLHHCTFITEKTYKAIAFNHPFLLISCPFSLEALQQSGYKTFSNCINENYDKIEDDSERLLCILDEVERLCHLSPAEEKNFIDSTLDICDYNRNILCTRTDLLKTIYPIKL